MKRLITILACLAAITPVHAESLFSVQQGDELAVFDLSTYATPTITAGLRYVVEYDGSRPHRTAGVSVSPLE